MVFLEIDLLLIKKLKVTLCDTYIGSRTPGDEANMYDADEQPQRG